MKPQFEPTVAQHHHDAANDSSAASGRDRISALLRRLEPAVAGGIAALIAWLAATSDSSAPVLWVLVLLAAGAAFGAVARLPRARPELARTDSSTALYNRGGLLVHGEALLARCRLERRELTLAVFDCSDLLEARVIYGTNTSRALIDCIVRKLTVLAGDQGLAARTGPAQFAVAIPLSRDKAAHAIERALGNPCRFELEGGNSEIVLVPDLMVEAVPQSATLEKLFTALCRGLTRIQEEEKTRLRYLQRERERHSRPLAARQAAARARAAQPTRAPRAEPDSGAAQAGVITMPMALTMRQSSGA